MAVERITRNAQSCSTTTSVAAMPGEIRRTQTQCYTLFQPRHYWSTRWHANHKTECGNEFSVSNSNLRPTSLTWTRRSLQKCVCVKRTLRQKSQPIAGNCDALVNSMCAALPKVQAKPKTCPNKPCKTKVNTSAMHMLFSANTCFSW